MEPLKYMYNVDFFEKLSAALVKVIPNFPEKQFIHHVFDTRWPELELKQRTTQVAQALYKCLPSDFSKSVSSVVALANHIRTTENFQAGYPLIFIPEYISSYGLQHFELSMRALEDITQLISAEFAIRPFILQYPEKTMRQMLSWSKHPSAAVRRLSSEGCRPRLPWAPALPEFKKDPTPVLAILENLKCDPSEFVRRSVANNLNDIAKDHPEIALEV